MTPEQLAIIHPQLFHVTQPGAWQSIKRYGLLSTEAAMNLFEAPEALRVVVRSAPRPETVPLHHPNYGVMELNDQKPMTAAALARCLTGGLAPADWLSILNSRVFFWPDEKGLQSLLGARMNRGRARDVLVFDTLSLATAHCDATELCPINSGSTIRRPALRGRECFTPLGRHSYAEWRKLRGGSDRIREVTLVGTLPDPADHIVDVRSTIGGQHTVN